MDLAAYLETHQAARRARVALLLAKQPLSARSDGDREHAERVVALLKGRTDAELSAYCTALIALTQRRERG